MAYLETIATTGREETIGELAEKVRRESDQLLQQMRDYLYPNKDEILTTESKDQTIPSPSYNEPLAQIRQALVDACYSITDIRGAFNTIRASLTYDAVADKGLKSQ